MLLTDQQRDWAGHHIGAAIVLLALFAVGLIAGLFPATHDD
jgi:hypothetical protein